MSLLKCENLSFAYDGVTVVRDLNFTVEEGDYLCIIGENGAGKSTLIKGLLRLKKPSAGKVELGEGLRATEIGYLPQQTQIQKDFPASVREVVLSGCLNRMGLRPFYTRAEKERARENMEALEILELQDQCYRDLSGGQQQRVLLARAMCAAQKLILLDEPVSGLDPVATRSLYAQMIGRGTRLSPRKENLLILDFLWLCKKHNLCKPANLVSDNEEDTEKVTRQTEEDEIDLFDAVTDAEEQRRSALAAALAQQQKKKSKLLNPLDVFTILDAELLDYEPIFPWESAEASEAQIRALENFGLDAEGVTKGYASKMLDKLIKRADEGKATIRQINALRKHGYEPFDWTFEQASRKLSALAAVGWQRWRLHD